MCTTIQTNLTTYDTLTDRCYCVLISNKCKGKQQWLHVRDNVEHEHSTVISKKHFPGQFTIREDCTTRDDDSEFVVPRKRPKLTVDAYPIIIPN